jgi:hypothetical protein
MVGFSVDATSLLFVVILHKILLTKIRPSFSFGDILIVAIAALLGRRHGAGISHM